MTNIKKTSYQRRIERNLAKGLSRSAARGHARPGERTASGKPVKPDNQLNHAIGQVASGKTLTQVAGKNHISRERLRRAVAERGDYIRRGRRYHFIPRQRNDLPLYSNEESIRVLVDDANASRLGEFMAGVRKFLRTNKIEHLAPFVGGDVTDIQGRFHPFETDPEELYRLDAKGRAVFHQIYQLSN